MANKRRTQGMTVRGPCRESHRNCAREAGSLVKQLSLLNEVAQVGQGTGRERERERELEHCWRATRNPNRSTSRARGVWRRLNGWREGRERGEQGSRAGKRTSRGMGEASHTLRSATAPRCKIDAWRISARIVVTPRKRPGSVALSRRVLPSALLRKTHCCVACAGACAHASSRDTLSAVALSTCARGLDAARSGRGRRVEWVEYAAKALWGSCQEKLVGLAVRIASLA
eukprot:6205224-Pleurochrysis_carterae.AAC.2